MRVQFIVYADFESFTVQLSTCQPNPEKSSIRYYQYQLLYTKQYQKHIPRGFFYHIKCFDDILYSQQPVAFVKEFNDDDESMNDYHNLYKMYNLSDVLLLADIFENFRNFCMNHYGLDPS